MFDAQGNYSLPDMPTRHVHVVTKEHVGPIGRQMGQFAAKITAGTVIKVAMLGVTNVPGAVRYQHPQADAVWIEHATAQVGDVLTAAEVAAGVALMAQRKAAIEAYRKIARDNDAKAEAAAKIELANNPPLTGAERAELRKLLGAKPTP